MPNTGDNRMNMTHSRSSRRAFLGMLAFGASALTAHIDSVVNDARRNVGKFANR